MTPKKWAKRLSVVQSSVITEEILCAAKFSFAFLRCNNNLYVRPGGGRAAEIADLTNMGSTLRKGQKMKPVHPAVAEREWGVKGDAVGAVICSYRVLIEGTGAAERVDIAFDSGLTVWGAPATEFAVVPEVKAKAH